MTPSATAGEECPHGFNSKTHCVRCIEEAFSLLASYRAKNEEALSILQGLFDFEEAERKVLRVGAVFVFPTELRERARRALEPEGSDSLSSAVEAGRFGTGQAKDPGVSPNSPGRRPVKAEDPSEPDGGG